MGRIASIIGSKGAITSQNVREAVDRGRALWRRNFGTDKESGGRSHKETPRSRSIPGGSWGRGIISEPAAFKRLLEAMRSMAPGGWS